MKSKKMNQMQKYWGKNYPLDVRHGIVNLSNERHLVGIQHI